MPPQPGICDLPVQLLQSLCLERLTLKDSVALLCTCRRLWQLGGSSIWPSLETLELDITFPTHVPSLFRWLQRRQGSLKRLKWVIDPSLAEFDPADFVMASAATINAIGTADGLSTGIFLLGALLEGQLVSLCWDTGKRWGTSFSAGTWLTAFPSLKHLAMPGTSASLTTSLLQLTALTCLRLECGPLPSSEPCSAPFIPTSLRRLELVDIDTLPAAVFTATQLQALAVLNEDYEHWTEIGGIDVSGLDRLTGLTSLALRDCRLQVIPPVLTALTRLAILDLARNDLGEEVRDMSNVLAPLKALTALDELHLEEALQRVVKQLPLGSSKLKVLSFVSNDGRSDGSLPVDAAACAELRVLGCELSAAAASTTLLAELSRLEGIYLHGRGVVRPEVLEPVLTVLRTLPGLRLVLVNQKLAEGLGGYKVPSSSSPYSTRAWVAQQLPLREVASRRALDAWQELLPGKEVVVMEMWPEDGAQLGTFLSLRPPLSWDEVE